MDKDEIKQEKEEEPWEEQLVAIELVGMIDPDKLNMVNHSNTAVLVKKNYRLDYYNK